MKLVAAVRAVTTMAPLGSVVLQVTLSAVPRLSSSLKNIWLLAVTAVVFTTSVGLVPAAIATKPDECPAQTAGEAELAQAVAVRYLLLEKFPPVVPSANC